VSRCPNFDEASLHFVSRQLQRFSFNFVSEPQPGELPLIAAVRGALATLGHGVLERTHDDNLISTEQGDVFLYVCLQWARVPPAQ
jgi:hypothetical protein